MMVVEIAAGIAFDSMALLADGWHMSTHVSAFLVTTLAYHLSRRHSEDPRWRQSGADQEFQFVRESEPGEPGIRSHQ